MTVIGFDTFNNIGRKIFQCHLWIITKKFAAVYKNAIIFLAINLDLSIVRNLSSGNTFNQIFNHGTFRCFVGIGIIGNSVINYSYRRYIGSHYSCIQYHIIGVHLYYRNSNR